MEVISSIVTALAAGAAASLHPKADQAVKDSYAALKNLIQHKYPQIDLERLESDPSSQASRIIVEEGLRAVSAYWVGEMLWLTQMLLKAIQRLTPEIGEIIGIKVEEIRGGSYVIPIGERVVAVGGDVTGGIIITGDGSVIGEGAIAKATQLFNSTRSLTIHQTPRGIFDAAPSIARDAVDCTVFAPQKIAPEEQLLIQAFIHTSKQTEKLIEIAKAADPQAILRATTLLSTEIARGSRLMFALSVPHLLIDEPIKEIVWRGREVSAQFSVTAPKKLAVTLAKAQRPLSVVAAISVSQDGVAIGQIKFVLQIERKASKTDNSEVTGEATRYQTAFISYASPDRPEVLRRVQMLRLVGIDYFQDLLSLNPGQRWAQQLYQHIDTSDILFLFWSAPAKRSKWVTKEWRYGLKQKGLDFIKPVIIEGPPPVPPPKALEKLHFNDWLQYVIRAEEAARADAAEG